MCFPIQCKYVYTQYRNSVCMHMHIFLYTVSFFFNVLTFCQISLFCGQQSPPSSWWWLSKGLRNIVLSPLSFLNWAGLLISSFKKCWPWGKGELLLFRLSAGRTCRWNKSFFLSHCCPLKLLMRQSLLPGQASHSKASLRTSCCLTRTALPERLLSCRGKIRSGVQHHGLV